MSAVVDLEDKYNDGIVDPVERYLRRCRLDIFLAYPFYGRVLLEVELVLVDAQSWCQTAATDGLRMYWNRSWVLTLIDAEVYFVFAHELIHIIRQHIGRCPAEWDEQRFNVACDYIINWTLVTEKIGKMPPKGCFDRDFTDELTPEMVYEIMLENPEKYASSTTFDSHFSKKAPPSAGEDGEASDEDMQGESAGEKSDKPCMSRSQCEDVQRQVRDIIRNAAVTETSLGRPLPDAVAGLVHELLNPRMNWKEHLDAFCRSQMRSKRSYARPSRMTLALYEETGEYVMMPYRIPAKTIDIVVAQDESGSMTTQMLKELHAEIVGIARQWRDPRIMVISWHDIVFNVAKYNRSNLDDIETRRYSNEQGGTNFDCVHEYLKSKQIKPKRLVVFTDGLLGSRWGDPTYCDTLWVVHSDVKRRVQPPYGEIVRYD